MATYKGIQGFTWQKVSSDPSDAVAGQVWYNSTAGTAKAELYYNGVWSTSSATMNNGRKNVGYAGSSGSDGVVAGGIYQSKKIGRGIGDLGTAARKRGTAARRRRYKSR